MRTSFAESWFPLLLAAATFATPAHAADSGPAGPAPPARGHIAIIIDDLGEQHLGGLHAARLPGPVALAFLPGAPYTVVQARHAHALGKEVLLHLPMQPAGNARAYPTSLTADADPAQLREYLRVALESVPYVAGVNNHQGSLMTSRQAPMDWLMGEIALRPGLYFVDSRTTPDSVAYRAARQRGIPSTERNVFLDAQRGERSVRAAFAELIGKAQRHQRALAIGHPYPETFKVLEEELPYLAARYGVSLVSPSELIARQSGWRGPRTMARARPGPALTLVAGRSAAAR